MRTSLVGVPVEELVRRLRRWTSGNEPHVRAAVELLIRHDFWLRRPDFVSEVLYGSDHTVFVDWRRARHELTYNAFASASTTQEAILDLAVALGEDRFRLSRMDGTQAQSIQLAVTAALSRTVPSPTSSWSTGESYRYRTDPTDPFGTDTHP
jgi:hypothetical protein